MGVRKILISAMSSNCVTVWRSCIISNLRSPTIIRIVGKGIYKLKLAKFWRIVWYIRRLNNIFRFKDWITWIRRGRFCVTLLIFWQCFVPQFWSVINYNSSSLLWSCQSTDFDDCFLTIRSMTLIVRKDWLSYNAANWACS